MKKTKQTNKQNLKANKVNSVPVEQPKAHLLKKNLILLSASPGLCAGQYFNT